MGSGLGDLSRLLGSGPVPCGTWFFADGRLLPSRLKNKTRNVVVCRSSSDGAVIVLPRSTSQKRGRIHEGHSGHPCSASSPHTTVRNKFNAHSCHVDEDGWVDDGTPITLSLNQLDGYQMCFEDENSPLLTFLQGEH